MVMERDLLCARCGYDLRTLAFDANCPECSFPVACSNEEATERRPHGPLLLGAISVGGACLFALVFTLTLPRGWRVGMKEFGGAWWVFGYAAVVAVVSGLLVWPLSYFCLRNKRLSTSVAFVYGVVLAVIIGWRVLDLSPDYFNWVWSYFAVVGALVFCAWGNARIFERSPQARFSTGEPSPIWRYVLAVAAGGVTLLVVHALVIRAAAHVAPLRWRSGPEWFVFMLACSGLASMLGGYVTAIVAMRSPMKAVATLAVIVGLLLAGITLTMTEPYFKADIGPVYRQLSGFLVVSVGFILLGGRLQRRGALIDPSTCPAR